MTIGQALEKFQGQQVEIELLLSNTLQRDRSYLRAFPELNLSKKQQDNFEKGIKRLHNHEPLAYILGYKEFYGRKLLVNGSVLIPRPETEILVEKVLENSNGKKLTIVDVGTGSGVIAITLKLEQPQLEVIATDFDSKALSVAKLNAKMFNLQDQIKFFESNLLQKVNQKIDIIATNLPYIKTTDWKKLEPKIKNFEPRIALDSGNSQMSLYKKLFEQAKTKLTSKGKIFYEIDGDIMQIDRSNL